MFAFISSSRFDFNFAYIINFKTVAFIRQFGNLTQKRLVKYHEEEVVYFWNKTFKNYLKPRIFKT